MVIRMLPPTHAAKALAAVALLASLTGCSSSDSDPDASPKAEAAAATTAAPTKDAPKTHDFTVTIRDKGRSYAPGTCAALEQPSSLAFSDPDNRPVGDEYPLPEQAEPRSGGTCEATMKVTVPYAPKYVAGVAVEGMGVADPEHPRTQQTKIVTKGDSQDIVILNHPR